VPVFAGSATFDFNTNPSGILTIIGNGEWRQDGGVSGQAGDGYLSITDSINSQSTKIIFDDFDAGLVVKAFTFSCDLRIGNAVGNNGRPADGFSLNYVRANDYLLDETLSSGVGWSGTVNEPGYPSANGLPEEGSNTGIAIGFDTWDSGSALWPADLNGTMNDIEGISVRVDNKVLTQVSMPTRNGACDDTTSMQTGPYTPETEGSPDGLCWQPFTVVLDESAKLTVTWKGRVLLNAYQTTYSPSAGRLVFGGRTGGANENHHVDNIKITTVPADKIVIGNPGGLIYGFTIDVSDSGPSVCNAPTAVIKLDGTQITPTKVDKVGTMTTFTWANPPNALVSGSTHTVDMSVKDTRGIEVSRAGMTFTAPTYTTVPVANKLAAPATGSGFTVRVHQMEVQRGPDDANFTRNAETHLADGYIDPATDQPYANLADLTFATMGLFFVETINWEQDMVDVGGEVFGSTVPVDDPRPNDAIPGIPGSASNPTDSIVAEALGYVQLEPGREYRWGVASDDGFKVSIGPDAGDCRGTTLGQFNGGRGVASTIFSFIATEPGYYGVRLLWWEGTGGANVEFYSINPDTGVRVLLNDPTAAGAVKVYRTGQGRAFLKSILPYPGKTGVATKPLLKGVLVDGRTQVVAGSIELKLDGTAVTPTINKVGQTTTVSYTPAAALAPASQHTSELTYVENTVPPTTRTVTSTWNVRFMDVSDIVPQASPPCFVIEAEDFDHGGGLSVDAASIMPYSGGAYDGLGADHNVDYYQNSNEPASDLYRTGESPNVPMDPQTGANTMDVLRPGYEVTTNYKIGWAGNGEWYNYTRTIPAGVYTAYAACSIGSAANVGISVGMMEGGNYKDFGRCWGPAPGGWGNNGLVPMVTADGAEQVFKLPGGKTTIRAITRNGDFDWFVLVPRPSAPPTLVSRPDTLSMRRDQVVLDWVIEDMATKVVPGAIQLVIGGVDKTAEAQITDTAAGATVHYAPAGLQERGTYQWALTFGDNSAPPQVQTKTGIFKVNPYPTEGTFLVEAEDFNYDAGKWNPQKGTAGMDVDVMPYMGGAYQGLGAEHLVDYRSDDGDDDNPYRTPLINSALQNEDMNGNLGGRWGTDRGTWEVTANFKIGWVSTSEWNNYTRTFPANEYEVWAALSYDSRTSIDCRGQLFMVTSPANVPDQTVQSLGIFRNEGTGGWGANDLVAMTDAAGAVQKVALGGVQTVRFNQDSGDIDYLLFVPVGVARPKLDIKLNANGSITVSWEGGGMLQAAPTVLGPWVDVPTAASPYTFTPTEKMLFGRIKR
jgi:hypothetical protein